MNALTSSPSPPDLAQLDRVAEGLFCAFVYVADAGEGLAAGDVTQWHKWVRQPRPQAPEALRQLFDRLAASFEGLWKRRVASGVRPGAERIAQDLQCWQVLAGSREATLVRDELDALLEVCAPRRPTPGALPWARRATPRERLDARAELETACQSPGAAVDAAPAAAGTDRVAPTATPAADAPGGRLEAGGASSTDALMLPAWPRRGVRLRCEAVIDETADVRSFVFRAVQPQLFAYQPGQFITLELPLADGRTLKRSYTVSSSPSRPHTLAITVKRVHGGRGSNWIHDNVKPGFECKVTGPHGHFSCGALPQQRKLLLIAAGSGITPIMSMLRWLADTFTESDVVVINNVHTAADVIFDAELRFLSHRMGSRLKLTVVPSQLAPGQPWSGPTGRFSAGLLQDLAPDWMHRTVYCCGPAPYMTLVRETLAAMGLPTDRYHEESFGADPGEAVLAAAATTADGSDAPASRADAEPDAAAPPAVVASAGVPQKAPRSAAGAAEVASIRFLRSGLTAEVLAGEGLLEVAEDLGVPIPSSCRAGTCGTCKVQKIRGVLEMDEPQALSQAELESGWVLCCVGRVSAGLLEIDA